MTESGRIGNGIGALRRGYIIGFWDRDELEDARSEGASDN